MTTILLLLAALCPPHAESSTIGVGSRVPFVIYAGQPITIDVGVVYFDIETVNLRTNAAFSGGTLTVTIGPNTFDVTPTNGIPLVGPPSCAPSYVFITPFRHTFCEPGDHAYTVNYRNENGPFGLMTASHSRIVHVQCQSPMFITKQGDNVLVRWYGYGRFSLEASEDLKAWTEVGVVGTGDECEDLSMVVPGGVGVKFFRYRRLQ